MQLTRKKPLQIKNICALIFCCSLIILGAICCGYYRGGVSVTQPPLLSSGQCKGNNVAPVAGERTLTVAAQTGPNVTLCILRASDGILLRHYDLALHGTILGSGDGLLYMNVNSALCAIHISDGLERWCQPQQNPTSIVVGNGNVYATSSDSSTGQTLITALSERNGRVLWTSSVLAAPDGQNFVSLTAGPDMLYSYQTLPAPSLTPTTSTNQTSASVNGICALRASDGQQRWCDPLANERVTGMVVNGNTLYARGIGLYAFNSTNGTLRWSAPIGQAYASNGALLLTVAHGIVFTNIAGPAAIPDELYAIRASDGKQLWHFSQQEPIASVAATDKSVYAVARFGGLQVLNILDGTPAWSYGSPLGSTQVIYENQYSSAIAVEQNRTYMLISADTYSYLIAVNADDGAPVWQDQSCSDASATPTASPGMSSSKRTTDRCYWTTSKLHQGQGNTLSSVFQVDN